MEIEYKSGLELGNHLYQHWVIRKNNQGSGSSVGLKCLSPLWEMGRRNALKLSFWYLVGMSTKCTRVSTREDTHTEARNMKPLIAQVLGLKRCLYTCLSDSIIEQKRHSQAHLKISIFTSTVHSLYKLLFCLTWLLYNFCDYFRNQGHRERVGEIIR